MTNPNRVMEYKPILTLAQSQDMAQAAMAEAKNLGCCVTIAIVDDGGHILIIQRMDGASPMSGQVAPEKATLAANARRETKLLEGMVNGGRLGLLSSPNLQGMIEGGVPVMHEGQCVGALGVSGAKPEEDTQIARAGVAAFR
jgi:glc operon protein GlcG